MRLEASDFTAAVLWIATSMISSIKSEEFFCSSHQALLLAFCWSSGGATILQYRHDLSFEESPFPYIISAMVIYPMTSLHGPCLTLYRVTDSINESSEFSQLLVVIYKALCFDVTQGRMNGAPNETRTHSCRFASLAC